jgi:transposase
MKKQRKRYTPEDKVAILKGHLMEGVPISDLCDELGLQPTVFYRCRWSSSSTGRLPFSKKRGPATLPNRNESLIWRD